MKSNTFLVSLIVLTILATSFVAAGSLDVSMDEVKVDGTLASGTVAAFAGETTDIKVVFTANDDADDVKVKAWIAGYRSDIQDSSKRFDIIDGSKYSEHLTLTLPLDIDRDEEYTLYIRIENKNDYKEAEYDLRIQRESYNSDVLFVEVPQNVMAGTSIPVDVVIKNVGRHELEDIRVKVSVPELGVQRRAYFGDIDAVDCEVDCDDCEEEDAVERTVYLVLPDDAEDGVYTLEVEAYNADSRTVVEKSIIVEGSTSKSEAIASVSSRNIAAGEETVYDVIIVNSGKGIGVFSLIPEETRGITVTPEETLVTVPGASSRVVKVNVKAASNAEEGTYNFAVNVHRGDELIQKVQLSANVEGKEVNTVVIATVVLAIVFIVLLIVLIVLLTRKPEKTEFEETSYY